MNITEKYDRLLNILDLAQQASRFTIAIFDPCDRTMQLFDGVHAILDDEDRIIPKFGLLSEFIRYVHPDDWGAMIETLDTIVDTRTFLPYDFRAITDSGDTKHIRNFGAFFTDSDGKEKILIVSSDVTNGILLEQLKDERQAMLTHKRNLESLREMFKNISHHWRQPLTIISICAESLRYELERCEPIKSDVKDAIDTIVGEVHFLSGTIEFFKKIAQEANKSQKVDVAYEVEAAIRMLDPKLKEAQIEVKLECTELSINAEPNEIMRAVYGMLENAYDSILRYKQKDPLHKGEIEVKVKNIGGYAKLSVIDNGIGLSEKIIDNIFEPYFTTKFQARSVGLTLFVTRHVIREHFRGEIAAYDIPTGGAEFVITFPIECKT